MAKRNKRKVSLGKVLFTVLLVAMLVVLGYFGIVALKDKLSSNNTKPVENKTPTNEVNGDVSTLSLLDYDVYKDEAGELGFNFVIAKVKFQTSDNSVFVDLSNMQTSEKVNCAELDQQFSTLRKYNYDLSQYDITKSYVKSDSNEISVYLLIPYYNAKGELKVYCNSEVLKFDLTKAKSAESLVKSNVQEDQIVSDTETNKSLTVSRSYISDMMQKNGERLEEPSTSFIYTFNLKVNDIAPGVSVKDARFVKKGSTYENEALDSSISSYEIDNIIGKTLKVGDTYALFFRIIQNGDAPIDYNGTLRIQFTDSDKWIEIPTYLN